MIYHNSQRKVTVGLSKKEGAPDFAKHEILPLADLCGSGRLLTQIVLPSGAQVPEHTHHDEFEVYFILSGEGDYNDNGTTVHLTAGDVALCRDGETHGVVNTGKGELSFVAFIGFANPQKQ